jgi:ribosomal protein S21
MRTAPQTPVFKRPEPDAGTESTGSGVQVPLRKRAPERLTARKVNLLLPFPPFYPSHEIDRRNYQTMMRPGALPCHPMPITLGPFQYPHDGIASVARRAGMGVRIEVEEGEPIADALRRFRKQIFAEGGYPLIYPCKWHKRSPLFYVKPSVLNRRRRWIIRVSKRGCGAYNPEWEYDWADDLETRPRRSWGPLGRVVVT